VRSKRQSFPLQMNKENISPKKGGTTTITLTIKESPGHKIKKSIEIKGDFDLLN